VLLPASPGQAPALAADVVYGLDRIDASGRVADRTVTCALGWHGGDRLTLTAGAGIEWPAQGSCEPDALSRGMQAARAMTMAPAGCCDERPRGWRGPAEDRS
jgi:hypothetical protein